MTTWENQLKISTAIIFTTSTVCCATAFADTQDIKASNNQVSVQFISTDVNYTETGNGRLGTTIGTLDTEKGTVPGGALTLSVMRNLWLGDDYLQFQFSRNSGNTDYTGALQSGGSYGSLVGQSGATMTDFSGRYGKGFELSNNVMITPYGELAHHKWQRNVNEGETYTNSYFGIGALAQFSPVQHLVLSANALLGETFGSHIDVAGPNSFSGALGNSGLYKIGLSADYAFTKNLHGNVGVDYTSFKYGISSEYPIGNSIYWEPDSTTKYTTVSVGIGYAF